MMQIVSAPVAAGLTEVFLAERGITQNEMDRGFNMGIGFALIVAPYFAESIRDRSSTVMKGQMEHWS